MTEFNYFFQMYSLEGTNIILYYIKIITNEILVFLFLLYKYRNYRKLPIIINMDFFVEWNRVLWLKNSSYRYVWVKWKRDEGGGDMRGRRVQVINGQNG